MKVLIVGNGGREHAIAWTLAQSQPIEAIYCAPGNGGTASAPKCENLPIAVTAFEAIAAQAQAKAVDLVVVGPEVPLAAGITDYLQAKGITVFGPTQAGAQIEASKAWAKDLMVEAGIPTAASETFTDPEAAIAYIKAQGTPIVVKADGLAAGKGVTVARSEDEAIAAVRDALSGRFGAAGHQVVIEEYLQGQEASVLAVTDGRTIRPLLPAQDHKPIGEGDAGPNTGGMGAYAPTPVVSDAQLKQIQQDILEPAIAALQQRGIDYRGVLYAGLMMTLEDGPKVIEFNCRFGDPETQVVLPLLETPLEEILLACCQQRLGELAPIVWKPQAAACIILAAGGYPDAYKSGYPISGLDTAGETALVFHAGTEAENSQIVTAGGRVLGVTALGATFDAAIAQAYGAVDQIQFTDQYCRRDIGYRVRQPQ
ncbi:MAG: phosphoribosylamine--glycine ligase [Cyanobacteria bacterium P01_A01_bin.135]